jgi:hypothetical protein
MRSGNIQTRTTIQKVRAVITLDTAQQKAADKRTATVTTVSSPSPRVCILTLEVRASGDTMVGFGSLTRSAEDIPDVERRWHGDLVKVTGS